MSIKPFSNPYDGISHQQVVDPYTYEIFMLKDDAKRRVEQISKLYQFDKQPSIQVNISYETYIAEAHITKNIIKINPAEYRKHTPDVRNFVLAHEIAHLYQNENNAMVNNMLFRFWPAAWVYFSGVVYKNAMLKNIGVVAAVGIYYFLIPAYQREMEFDADKRAVETLRNKKGGIEFFQREIDKAQMHKPLLNLDPNREVIFSVTIPNPFPDTSDHPSDKDRQERMKKLNEE